MGMKNRHDIDIQEIQDKIERCTQDLEKYIKPYFKFKGIINLEEEILYNLLKDLSRILNLKIIMHRIDYNMFCIDSLIERQIEVTEDGRIQFWGHVYWLGVSHRHQVNASGKDPFYCELKYIGEKFVVSPICCGDYGLLNIDKYWQWWKDFELDWVFKFE